MSRLFDQYETHARLAPGLVSCLPIAVLLLALGSTAWPWAVGGLAVELLLAIPLAVLARDRGKAIEAKLWEGWGGPPLARRLAEDQSATSEAARQAVSHLVSGIAVPGQPLGVGDSVHRYAAASDVIRHRVRQLDGHQIVAAENRQYGYQRNSLGMRPVGVSIAIASTAGAAVLAIATPAGGAAWMALIATTGLALFWMLYPSRPRTRAAAERYADAVVGLLAASGDIVDTGKA